MLLGSLATPNKTIKTEHSKNNPTTCQEKQNKIIKQSVAVIANISPKDAKVNSVFQLDLAEQHTCFAVLS